MNNEAMIQQHAAEIARHAKAIQELQAPKLAVSDDLKMHAIMVTGRHRIKHAVASVIDRHAQLWRLEKMVIFISIDKILARMEPDPCGWARGHQWLPSQIAIGRQSTFKPHNMIRSRLNDAENMRRAIAASSLANDRSHHGALHGRGYEQT